MEMIELTEDAGAGRRGGKDRQRLRVRDQRPRARSASAPPAAEDVVGAFIVRDGRVSETYFPNEKHRLLTDNGFFRLSDTQHQRLLEEISAKRPDA
jgi:hypothetical protein